MHALMAKRTITPKQVEQFNRMHAALMRIAKGYATPDQLRRNSRKEYGLEFEECIEMVYENLQDEARRAVKGVSKLKALAVPVVAHTTHAPSPGEGTHGAGSDNTNEHG